MSKKPRPFKIENVTLGTIGARGDASASYKGKPLYVAKGAEGDVADIEAFEKNDGAYAGRILKLHETSPDRVNPPCPYYARCGGCSLQHISDGAYHRWSEGKISYALGRADIAPETPLTMAYLPASIRHRATFAAFMHKGKVMLGYHEQRTHNIIDIGECLVLEPALMELAKGLKTYLPRILPENRPVDLFIQHVEGQTELVFTGRFGRGGELDLPAREALAEAASALKITRIGWRMKLFEPIETILEFGPLTKSFGKIRVNLPYAAFLQPSLTGEETLVQAVIGALDGETSFLDLFAGNGTFAGALLKYGKVHAVESEKGCILRLQATGADGLTAERRDLFEDPMLLDELNRYDCVVLDPPRAGAKAQAEKLAASSVSKIIYVSCNPATFARDAAILVKGGYAFKSLQGIDQFIWSAHLECVGVFTRA